MEWTKKQKIIAAVVVAVPFIVILVLMYELLKSPAPTEVVVAPTAAPAPVVVVTHQSAKAAGAVPLDSFLDMHASGFAGITTYGWGYVPRDAQVFSGVALHIDGNILLWGRSNSEQQNANYRESVTGIPVNQKFASLYVYHATFYASPAKTPVYDLVLRYEDGTSVTNEVQYGAHVFDWYSRPGDTEDPTAENSIIAWRGKFTANDGGEQGLRFCLTEFKNPKPSVQVTSIDLYSCKNASAGCISAITTGPSGLVHNKNAK